MSHDRTPHRSVLRRTAGGALLCLGVLTGCGTPAPAAPVGSAASSSVAPDVTSAPPAPPAATSSTAAAPAPAPTPTAPTTDATAATGTALALVDQLQVKGRAPRTGYDRDLFGQAWADTDRNGCDTRNDLLRRDLTAVVLKEGTNGCVVLTGVLQDPFSGSPIAFERGTATSGAVQIDHVVALSDAWQKGAQQWSPQRRVAFANDPLNLLAVDGPLNGQKSDGDAATWLPPNRGFRCAYVARQVAVKAKFAVWVTAAEGEAMRTVLTTCPAEPVPASASPTESDVGAAAEPVVAPAPAAAPSPPAPGQPVAAPPAAGGLCEPAYPSVCIAPLSGGDLDCGEVAATGFAVLPPDPHGFDRDGDGVGCVG